MITKELNKVGLDVIEMYLEVLKINQPETIRNSNYAEIAQLIEANFNVFCSEEVINLLHEPTIEQEVEDLQWHFKSLGF